MNPASITRFGTTALIFPLFSKLTLLKTTNRSFRKCLTLLTLFIFLFLTISCTNNPYPGYTKNDEGIYYKLLVVGENEKCCNFGDIVTANISYITMNDSVFFNGIRKMWVSKPDFLGSINKCFTLICKNDSAVFIISAIDFFEKTLGNKVPEYLLADGKMKVSVNILDIQTAEEYEDEKEAFMHWIEDLGEYEKVILKQYINNEKIDITPNEDGLYYIELQAGFGDTVTVGDTITIHYEGYFLNGRFFDSTRQRNEPMQFVYGQQWQVIPGIEKALGYMRNGEKGLVIIPSEMAFGADGSVYSIVPPFTSVVFEIEILSVKN